MAEEMTQEPEQAAFRVGVWQDLTPGSQFYQHFGQIKHAIAAGDTYQINYTTINDCVVVGSSGWNQDDWQELKNSTALIVNSDQSYKVVNL